MATKKEKKFIIDISYKSLIKIISNGITSFHGIPNILKAEKSSSRFIWLLFTLISALICAILIYKDIFSYLSYQYVSNIDVIYEQPMEFPTISICSCIFNISMPLSSFLKSCIFNNDNGCKKNPENFFIKFKDPRYGICYRFNSGKTMNGSDIDLLKTSIAGRSGGLQVEVNETNGLLIFIHNSSIPPYPNENYNNINGYSIFVSTGFSTDLAIDRVFTQRLGEPYNQCVKTIDDFGSNQTLYQFILDKNYIYSQQRCYKLCFDLDYISNNPCNCTNNVTIDNVWQKCFVETEKEDLNGCTFKYKAMFNKESLTDKCDQYCPIECDSFEYTTSYSFHITESLSKSDTLKFKAYYKELKYVSIRQDPKMDRIDLIANIGGLFGLFLGASFLSLVEIFELMLEIFYLFIPILICRNKAQNEIQKATHQNQSDNPNGFQSNSLHLAMTMNDNNDEPNDAVIQESTLTNNNELSNH